MLANDIETDDSDELTILASIVPPENGTASIVDVDNRMKIRYEPNQDFTTTDTPEKIVYSVSDGEATSAATVEIHVNDLVFTRSHDETISAGAGLTVSVEVTYSSSLAGEDLILTETFPRWDNARDFYKIAAGSGINSLDISAENAPNSVTDSAGNALGADPASPVAIFTWNADSLPASPFTFQYRITGGADDATEKVISGTIRHGDSSEGIEVVTRFTPGTSEFHEADSNTDGKIDPDEFLEFVGPVVDVFQLGVDDGKYCWNGVVLAPDEGEGCQASSQIHPADVNTDGKIDPDEFLEFVGPAVDVFQLGVDDGKYCWDGTNLKPDLGQGCEESQ